MKHKRRQWTISRAEFQRFKRVMEMAKAQERTQRSAKTSKSFTAAEDARQTQIRASAADRVFDPLQ